MAGDPYSVLGIPPGASDADVRAAYRRLVKLHHPDHNAGSPEAAVRFEAVQDAYAEIQRRRAHAGAPGRAAGAPPPRQGAAGSAPPPRQRTGTGAPPPRQRASGGAPPPPPPADPELDRRLAEMERQVRKAAHRARQRAQRAARDAAREAAGSAAGDLRPTDEELGYITTDDTLSKILADTRTELTERYGRAREHPVARRVSDLIAGLEELAEGLDRPRGGDGPRRDRRRDRDPDDS